MKKCPECGQEIAEEKEEKKVVSKDSAKEAKKDMIVMVLQKKGKKDAKG